MERSFTAVGEASLYGESGVLGGGDIAESTGRGDARFLSILI